MRLALVTIPCSNASTIPRFTPGDRPKSSAFTMSIRVPGTLHSQPVRDHLRLRQPVVAMFGRRLPLGAGPAEPLHRQVKAAVLQVRQESLAGPCHTATLNPRLVVGEGDVQALLLRPASRRERS